MLSERLLDALSYGATVGCRPATSACGAESWRWFDADPNDQLLDAQGWAQRLLSHNLKGFAVRAPGRPDHRSSRDQRLTGEGVGYDSDDEAQGTSLAYDCDIGMIKASAG